MFKLFWRIKVLPSAQVIIWRVLENKIVTKANLHRCGIAVEVFSTAFVGLKRRSLFIFFYCRITCLV